VIHLLGLAIENLAHVRSKSKYLEAAKIIVSDIYAHGIREDRPSVSL